MTKLTNIPEALIQEIQTFLTKDDYHYLMNTSKEHFNELKYNTIYFSLNEEKSWQYLEDPYFQSILLNKVDNGWKQIGIKLAFKIESFPMNLPVHKVQVIRGSFFDCSTFRKHLCHIESVDYLVRMTEIPPIPKVKMISLLACEDLRDVTNLSHLSFLEISEARVLEDIKPLQKIADLGIYYCNNIYDFSMLNGKYQKRLEISNCPRLCNVSNFASIRTLIIDSCPEVEDISSLYGVYDLTIAFCRKVKDISKLGGHHGLSIEECSFDLKGYESLKNIRHINLRSCNISNLTVLEKAKMVKLTNCPDVRDVSPMKNAHGVMLVDCYGIENLPELKNVSKLILLRTPFGDDEVNQFQNHRLAIDVGYDEFNINDYSFLSKIQYFDFRPNQQFLNLLKEENSYLFKNLQSLTIRACSSLIHVNGLGDIPTVRLHACDRLRDITGLGRKNKCVELSYCAKIEDVSSLANVPVVTITYCYGIKDYSCLSKVPRLKVAKELQLPASSLSPSMV